MGVLFQVDEMYDIIEVIKLSESCSDDSLEPGRRLNRALKKEKRKMCILPHFPGAPEMCKCLFAQWREPHTNAHRSERQLLLTH